MNKTSGELTFAYTGPRGFLVILYFFIRKFLTRRANRSAELSNFCSRRNDVKLGRNYLELGRNDLERNGPNARFSKNPVTLRALNHILKSKFQEK